MKTQMISRFAGIFLLWGAVILITGCGGSPKPGDTDTATSGMFKVGVDDSYSLLTDAELFTFQSLYPYSKVDTFCRSEADIINSFMKDSIELMIVCRKLTKDEESVLNSKQIYPKTTKIAFDAVAFILNKDNPDSNLFYDRISDIFNGKIKTWKQLNPKSKLGDIKVVFDNYKSCNTRYFREKFSLARLPEICYAANRNSEVINFVKKNPGTIGIISVNWVSDKADTISHRFLNDIRIAGISAPGAADPDAVFLKPYQAYIADNTYPFTREVYCINRQPYLGLAYGISSFIAGEKGQLIILHSGMVPAAMPVRLMEVKQ